MMLPTHSTKGMYVHPDKTMTVDISELSRGGLYEVFGQVYDDACDQGFALTSHKTGRTVRMVVDRTVHDSEGELLSWLMRSVREDERKLGLGMTIELTVHND